MIPNDPFDEFEEFNPEWRRYLDALVEKLPEGKFALFGGGDCRDVLDNGLALPSDTGQRIRTDPSATHLWVPARTVAGSEIHTRYFPGAGVACCCLLPADGLPHRLAVVETVMDLCAARLEAAKQEDFHLAGVNQLKRQIVVLEQKYQEILEDNQRQYEHLQNQQARYANQLESEVSAKTVEIREINRKLMDRNRLNQIILDNAATAIFTVDTKKRITDVNKAFCLITGYDRTEIIDRGCNVISQSCEMNTCGLFDLSSVAPITRRECSLKTKNGETRLIIKNADVIREEDTGKVLGGVESFVDVTDLIEMRKAAESANSAKSEFLATMSHEIRTPLNAVIGLNHLLVRTPLSEKQKDYVTKVQSASNNLLAVINDILDFSKIEARKIDMESVLFNLDDVLDHAADVFTLKTAQKGIEFVIDIHPDVPVRLVGDPHRLGQILLNLLGNAVKFTDAGEVVLTVSANMENESFVRIEFAVRDTGIGIAKDHTEKIFNSFSQVDSSTTRNYGGTGLGLAICRRLVELMKGRIWVESEPGKGSTFYFTARFSIASQDRRKFRLPSSKMAGMRVLVADGHDATRAAIVHMLQSFSFEVEAVPTCQTACDRLEKAVHGNGYRLVIFDNRLLEPLGPAFLWPLSSAADTLVVMTEGKNKEPFPIDGRIVKPVKRSALFNTIVPLFSPRKCTDENREESPKPKRSLLQGMHLLLVDDVNLNRLIARELLEQEGAVITEAENGQAAIDILEKSDKAFAAVLMDVEMPVMDGYEAVRRIRKNERFKYLPIIAMTAHAMDNHRKKSIEAGMNDHLTKPIEPDRLTRILSNWISPGLNDQVPVASIGAPEPLSAQTLKPSEEYPVLDTAEGISRTGGNPDRYAALIASFSNSFSDTAVQIETALENNDVDQAVRLVHTIKGLSGSIGAAALYRSAIGLEKQLQSAHGCGMVDAMGKFKKHLSQALTSIAAFSDTAPEKLQESAKANHSLPSGKLAETIADVEAMLEEDIVGAGEKIALLQKQVHHALHKKRLDDIAESIAAYDTDRAADQLKKLVQIISQDNR